MTDLRRRAAARRLPLLVLVALLAGLARPALAARPVAPQDDAELERLLAEERHEADRLRRRGDVSGARRILDQHLRDEPADAASRRILGLLRLGRADYERALDDLERARDDAAGDAELQHRCARDLADALLVLGRAAEAEAALASSERGLRPGADSRDAWVQARTLAGLGRREEAERVLALGADGSKDQPWDALLAKARCQRRLGRLEAASRALLLADESARRGDGAEPEVLAEFGALIFEADREVEEADSRSARAHYDEALRLDPTNEAATLGLFELHRTNWRRKRRPAPEILADALAWRPESVEARLVAAATDLSDGRLKSAREHLGVLVPLAAGRREVRTLQAALAWIEHREDDCEAILAELAAVDPHDARPERELAEILQDLYRFAEGLPFARRATEKDPRDHLAWTQLGRALANTGDEEEALEALTRARQEAGLRRDAWRENTETVLRKIQRDMVVGEHGEHTFVWSADAAKLLEVYLVPFYQQAREELAERYGYTPGPVRIEVFREHRDFSVRSVGFEGFPALGVCFGPVVTALSPLSEMRGNFSWARTSFHEFTHVIHLGLSHNRCPRWITEGLATWEEARRNGAWDRNMRRELVDALANDDLIPIRDLNRAFRGPRILFGYYEGGIVCDMLHQRAGFAPLVRLLEAFDRGLDLDAALREVYALTPEELDAELLAFCRAKTETLAIEPRWEPDLAPRLRLSLPRSLPDDAAGRAGWGETWTTLAWSAWQQGRRVDAEEALRQAGLAGSERPRALFLQGEMALSDDDAERAIELWGRAFEAGGEDFRARVALATLLMRRGRQEEAERHLLAAEASFPGFPEPALAAERRLVELYEAQDRHDDAMRAAERYLAYDSKEFALRRRVADWHMEAGRCEPAVRLLEEANQIDPFSTRLHRDWGLALFDCERWEEAQRELRVTLMVPRELDLDGKDPLSPTERARILALSAHCAKELGRLEEARELAREALELDDGNADARGLLDEGP